MLLTPLSSLSGATIEQTIFMDDDATTYVACIIIFQGAKCLQEANVLDRVPSHVASSQLTRPFEGPVKKMTYLYLCSLHHMTSNTCVLKCGMPYYKTISCKF